MIVLRFSMQKEGIFYEHTNYKCHVFTFEYARGNILLSILMTSVIRVHFHRLAYQCVT
jgi:hypothetical protein